MEKKWYHPYTDKYFLRSKHILEQEEINPYVRYQVFARKNTIMNGIDNTLVFLQDELKGKDVKIYSVKNGYEYRAGEVIMKIEGHVQDLIDLETVYLGLLCEGMLESCVDYAEIAQRARYVIDEAKDKPVYYFGARHYHWSRDLAIAAICQGAGFAGCSTDNGAVAWGSKGLGTIPHALVIAIAINDKEYGALVNATVHATKLFDKHIEKEVPRITLIDTFNREYNDSVASVEAGATGIRIDTCGENMVKPYKEEEFKKFKEALMDDYNIFPYSNKIGGNGVSINAVVSLKREMIDNGVNIPITVSSGFDHAKLQEFMCADCLFKKWYGTNLFDSVGYGVTTQPACTSDICAYREESGKWVPFSKVGRKEIEPILKEV